MCNCHCPLHLFFFFFFNDTATTEIYTLSLHDALPIWDALADRDGEVAVGAAAAAEGDVEIEMAHDENLMRNGECGMRNFREGSLARRRSTYIPHSPFRIPHLGQPKHHPRPLLNHAAHFQVR